MKKLAIASLFTLGLCTAHAQFYGELGYTSVTVKDSLADQSLKASPNVLRAIVGYEVNPNVSVELMTGLNLGSASLKLNGQELANSSAKVDRMLGVYLKPKMELVPGLEAFGRLGFMDASLKTTSGTSSRTNSTNGFSYGAGLSYALSKTMSVNLDYMHYGKKDASTAKGFTAGIGFKF